MGEPIDRGQGRGAREIPSYKQVYAPALRFLAHQLNPTTSIEPDGILSTVLSMR